MIVIKKYKQTIKNAARKHLKQQESFSKLKGLNLEKIKKTCILEEEDGKIFASSKSNNGYLDKLMNLCDSIHSIKKGDYVDSDDEELLSPLSPQREPSCSLLEIVQPTLSDKKLSQKNFINIHNELSNSDNNNEYELSSSYSKINDSFRSIQKDDQIIHLKCDKP